MSHNENNERCYSDAKHNVATSSSVVAADEEKTRMTMVCTSHLRHTLTQINTHWLADHGGTCLWPCLNSWNWGRLSALGLILRPAPWWVIGTDDKPVPGSYRAANPSAKRPLLN